MAFLLKTGAAAAEYVIVIEKIVKQTKKRYVELKESAEQSFIHRFRKIRALKGNFYFKTIRN